MDIFVPKYIDFRSILMIDRTIRERDFGTINLFLESKNVYGVCQKA